jgi:hypothetical protein
MNRLTLPLAVIVLSSFSQGCATSRQAAPAAPAASAGSAGSCSGPGCAAYVMRAAHKTEVPIEKNAPPAEGHPLTSVVVTQCNLIVAVYLTMPDGKLMRFDHTANVPADQLLQMAYTATRSERVEVSCNEAGVVGYEKHDPV